ncbi:MAG: AtpZ/AtpI family protein [Alphaproteobacteria bacterium]|nr:AtpZ/AtpI family protein [Alphaproteobacteria bacterium]
MEKNSQDNQNKIAALKEKLKKLQPQKNTRNFYDDDRKMLGIAARIGLEIVIALVVGVGIGYSLDKLFSTKPIFLLLFALFGIAAGVLNIYRLVKGNEYGSGYKNDDKKD